MSRTFNARYSDPLDIVWLACARRLGLQISRSDETYASWDGKGTLTLCEAVHFDPDDSLAQLILHEICHALVQGPSGRRRVDWGLVNTDDVRSAVSEHACHRLQAALLDRYGLRQVLAITTDWRPYWDALPDDPLAAGDDPAIPLAREAWSEALRGRWSRPLDEALQATAAIAGIVREIAPADSLWVLARPLHPLGVAIGPAGATCGGCAWAQATASTRCLAHAPDGVDGPAIDAETPACFRWEKRLIGHDCRSCGACCHRGFDLVMVADEDEVHRAHPDMVRRDDHGAFLPRPGGCCIALQADQAPWTCTIYKDRPNSCREFEIGGPACLQARRRVGLTRS